VLRASRVRDGAHPHVGGQLHPGGITPGLCGGFVDDPAVSLATFGGGPAQQHAVGDLPGELVHLRAEGGQVGRKRRQIAHTECHGTEAQPETVEAHSLPSGAIG
jgi:hypothetical protein